MNKLDDFTLGRDRAIHELRWMARGYVAYLAVYIHEIADRCEDLIDGHFGGSYMDGIRTVIDMVRLEHGFASEHRHENYRITCDQLYERLEELPEDPLDDPVCHRSDGQLPTTSRGYKETANV